MGGTVFLSLRRNRRVSHRVVEGRFGSRDHTGQSAGTLSGLWFSHEISRFQLGLCCVRFARLSFHAALVVQWC